MPKTQPPARPTPPAPKSPATVSASIRPKSEPIKLSPQDAKLMAAVLMEMLKR